MAAVPSWITHLQDYEAAHAIRGEVDVEHDVSRRFQQILEDRRKAAIEKEPSLAVIPRFYDRRLPRKIDASAQQPDRQIHVAQSLLRSLAHNQFLRRKSEELLTEPVLKQLFDVLSEFDSQQPTDSSQLNDENKLRGDKEAGFDCFLSYEDFCQIGESVAKQMKPFFTADTFCKFRRDANGCISAHLLFQYIYRRAALLQIRIQLSSYDTNGQNFLREQDLESFIYELIPNIDALADLQENFYPFYVFTAVRKFFFFLDPRRTGKASISDLVTSPVLHELIHLKEKNDGNDDESTISRNWFSAGNALRVYSQYLELDVDHNGMLSRSEMAKYGTGSLTNAIVDRIFAECLTYEGEMDYKSFLDFALAMETKKTSQSLAYFFRLLDINKVGFLDRPTINFFFREIVSRLQEWNGGVMGAIVRADDVIDEIFDMCKPANPNYITLDDLVRCGVGDTIVTMLIDLSGFWAYDNREYLIGEENQEENDELELEETEYIDSSESPMI